MPTPSRLQRDAAPVRRSAAAGDRRSAHRSGRRRGVRTLAFVRSRRGAELVASMARRSLDEVGPELAGRVAAYRAGYLPRGAPRPRTATAHGRRAARPGLHQRPRTRRRHRRARRGRDRRLSGHPRLAVAAGRAGGPRPAGTRCACWWPGTTRWTPTSSTTRRRCSAAPSRRRSSTRPTRYVLAPQLCCAAAELPLTPADLPLFGADRGARPGRPRRRRARCAGARRGWYWTDRDRPDVDDIRGARRRPGRGRGGGHRPAARHGRRGAAHHQVHDGAVHLHQGSTYVVDDARPGGRRRPRARRGARLDHASPATSPTSTVLAGPPARTAGPVTLLARRGRGDHQVVCYQRRRIASGEVIGTSPLDLPARILRTVAVWWTVSPRRLDEAGIAEVDLPGALHAAEHAVDRPAAPRSPPATAGTSAASPPPCTPTPACRPSSSTTATPAAPASPNAPSTSPPTGSAQPAGDRRMPLRAGLPVLRAVPQVRQRQQPPQQT